MSGTLYIVATPIGNLEDITQRAVRVLGLVDTIVAEDTRHTKKLLAHLNLHRPLVSYHRHNARAVQPKLISRLLQGEALALVSDAGTPAIADPGAHLVAAARAAGVTIVPIPGPSAVTTLLSVAGVTEPGFVFLGFLPEKRGKRQRALEAAVGTALPVVLYLARWDVQKYLTEIAALWPDARLVLGRELTKQFEEIYTGTVAEWLSTAATREPKGEFVAILQRTL